MKNKISIIISWLMVLLTMLIIFNFSGQNSTQSTSVSEGVVVDILSIFIEKEEITPLLVDKFNFPIRKLAHFGIYMLLGFCFVNALNMTFKLKIWIHTLIAAGGCLIYAIVDETHQGFSDGRSPQILDVIIDTSGAILGIALLLLVIYFSKKLQIKQVGLNQ